MKKLRTALVALTVWAVPLHLYAGELTADDIAESVSDHTFQGSMTNNAFAEYYAPDGTIRGKDYSGKWRTEDNTMCFQYGDNPENCWAVETRDSSMTMLKDGAVDGNGMLIEGNVHGF